MINRLCHYVVSSTTNTTTVTDTTTNTCLRYFLYHDRINKYVDNILVDILVAASSTFRLYIKVSYCFSVVMHYLLLLPKCVR